MINLPSKCVGLVVKVASRCNLNCTYCYMYNMGDETYRNQPKVMKPEVISNLLARVREHCLRHGIKKFAFGFHGGEPLLTGKKFYRQFVEQANELLTPEITPVFTLQTNGILLDEDWCLLFNQLNIRLSISLDGTPDDNNRFRIDHAGRGSYNRILKGLKIAYSSKGMVAQPGILSVINIDADPIKTYQHFKSLDVRSVDFLFPDATYDRLPLKPTANASMHPYADWLIKIFDQWFDEPHPKMHIRTFAGLVASVLGGEYPTDNMGEFNNELLVIETNGDIEAIDMLKICGDGFTKAGINVQSHGLDDAIEHDLANLYHQSHQKLCKQCLSCPVKNICGGGYLPNRYRHDNGFNNPSIYCSDLFKLIAHVQNKVVQQIPAHIVAQAKLFELSYEVDFKQLISHQHLVPEVDYSSELESFRIHNN
jgi:uncharacterized protein